MTATTTETAPWTAEKAAAETAKLVRKLADKMIADLGCIARVLDAHPEIAELLLPAYRSTDLSLHSVRDPAGTGKGTGAAKAKQQIAGAFKSSGARVDAVAYEGCFEGLSVWLPGGAMSLFFYTQTGDPAAAEAASRAAAEYAAAAFAKAEAVAVEAPDKIPAETPDEPVADDADPLTETAAFDTAAEVTS